MVSKSYLNIFDTVFCIDLIDVPILAAKVSEKFGAFIISPSGRVDIQLTVRMQEENCVVAFEGRIMQLARSDEWRQLDDIIRQLVLSANRGYLFIHGSSVQVNGGCALFVGSTTAGKTTLAVRLAQGECTLLSDDTTPVSLDSRMARSYCIRPNLRPHTALLAAEQGWTLLEGRANTICGTEKEIPVTYIFFLATTGRSGVAARESVDMRDGMSEWHAIYRFCVGEPLPSKHFTVTSTIQNGPEDFDRHPEIRPMGKAQALRELTRHLIAPHPPIEKVVPVIASIVANADIYELVVGKLEETVACVEQCLRPKTVEAHLKSSI